ncbi:SDR family NAD(P)-dependent oxidoreductase [Listeria grayi]|uniref:SDR family NAD(P)-dependent oxidoreductase n=1 Tax=Listeria grayi TaxID=1641 RepID=UPI0016246FE8|nr:SDR family NAD(P)-dependent oxidoreductase [Listeria grayi]MBC1922047.1 SDR family NAD(P)-dependent oxidoreductase [Listeria grayi]
MQNPLNNGGSARTTTTDVIKGIDLKGKIVVVTGGTAGLGLETVRTLASANAEVVVFARNLSKAKQALIDLPQVTLYQTPVDLSDRKTIAGFTDWFQANYQQLDILINCAGVMAIPFARDPLGNELQISSNYLGHYYLTKALLPLLKKTGNARIVNLSSRAHWRAPFDFEDPNFLEKPYDKWKAYAQAKTAVVLFTIALDELYKESGIRAFAVHPGGIVTGLSSSLTDEEMSAMGTVIEDGERQFSTYDEQNKTISEGAATIVWCAVSPQLEGLGGVYCENADISSLYTPGNEVTGVKEYAIDKELALELWEKTEGLFR